MEKKEYIERGAVIDILRKYSTENPSSLGRHSGVADIAMCEVDRVPAADVVEVVRCKDCHYYEEVEYYPDGTKNICRTFKRQMHSNDFCSYGERK